MEDIKLLKTFFATREEFEELKEKVDKIDYLPTKEEFYKTTDEMMGELKAIRESQDILVGRSSDHEERITTLEDDMDEVKKKVVVV